LRLGQKSLEKNSRNKPNITKANALLCPICCVEYVEVKFDFEVDGVILRNVKALRCPGCDEEVFSPEQHESIRKRIIDSIEF
jgi:YgiT-type zinc finger domain-containing protein